MFQYTLLIKQLTKTCIIGFGVSYVKLTELFRQKNVFRHCLWENVDCNCLIL